MREELLMLNYDKEPTFPKWIYNRDRVIIHINRDPHRPEDICAYLFIDGKVWMTTHRGERFDMENAVKQCPENSRVYIAGLGLGLVLLYLAQSQKSKEVLIAEIDHRVIHAVAPRIHFWFKKHHPDFKWRVINADAEELIKVSGSFDWIFWDIWPVPDFSKEAHEKYVSLSEPYLNSDGIITTWHNLVEFRKEMKFK